MINEELIEILVPWQKVTNHTWNLSQVKFHYDVVLGKMLQNSANSPADLQVPYLKAQHVQWDSVVLDNLPTMWANPNEVDSLRLKRGDLLVCEGGEAGRAAILEGNPPENCIIQNALHLVRPKEAEDLRFLRYTLQHASSQKWLEVLSSRATIAHFTSENFKGLWLWLPPKNEQSAIADFLDEKTAVIDHLITAKERLLTLLDEKRRALITHAVTRGLDTAVPLRDSGVEWIGRVPEHWEVVKLKMASESIQTGPFGSQLHAEEYIDNGIPVINPVHLVDGLIVPDLRTTVDDDTAKRLSIHQLETGDVVFARRGEIGRCSLVSERESGWLCGTGSLRVRLKKELIWPEYLNLFVSNSFASVWLSLMAVGTTMKNLNSEIIGDLEILVPPLAEQKTIVDYLDQNILKLQSLSQALQKTIALLQERRTALIAAAVSGQHPVADQS